MTTSPGAHDGLGQRAILRQSVLRAGGCHLALCVCDSPASLSTCQASVQPSLFFRFLSLHLFWDPLRCRLAPPKAPWGVETGTLLVIKCTAPWFLSIFWITIIHPFIHSNCFILVRITEDLDLIPGSHLGIMRQRIRDQTFTPSGNSALPIHLSECFLQGRKTLEKPGENPYGQHVNETLSSGLRPWRSATSRRHGEYEIK